MDSNDLQNLVTVDNVVKSFGKINALDGTSITLDAGEQYVIRGASGSGKSTLLYLLGGLDKPTLGDVIVKGKNLAKMNDEMLADYRNKFVGFVFQFHFLLPSMNCLNNILLPCKIGNFDYGNQTIEAKKLARELGVEHCLSKFPFELSGGEQQRINIIRAVLLRPPLLLCDEPTGNLDSTNSQNVIKLLRELAYEHRSTLVIVTHDDGIAAEFPREYFLTDGRVSSYR